MAVGQVIVTGIVMFLSYRLLLDRLGAATMGIWAVVLSTASTARLSEMGLAGSTTRFVAAAIANRDPKRAGAITETVMLSTIGVLSVLCVAAYLPILGLLAGALPIGALPLARSILPYAMLVVTLAAASSVAQAALDGCHRTDLRAWITGGSQVLYLPLAITMATRSGLVGLAVAQVLTSVALLVGNWLALRSQIESLSLVPRRWDYDVFRDVLKFGLRLQVVSLSNLLFEPATKLLMVRFSSLSAATYFDMAHRTVSQVRTLLVTANQVLIPRLTTLHETEGAREVDRLYRQTLELMLLLATPLLIMMAILAPLISRAWLGSVQPDFVYFTVVLAMAYWVNAISAPAYFTSIGTGALVWVIASHLVLGITTVALGAALGLRWGARGVGTGVAIAIIIASVITIMGLQRSRGLKMPIRQHLPMLASAVAALAIGLFVAENVLAAGMALTILLPAIWTHPMRGEIWVRIRMRAQLKPVKA